jgi:dolichol-phosphate mannosyltransferase
LRRPQEARPGSASANPRRKWRFLQVAVGVPLAVFVAVSLRHDVKFDWTGELWLAALPAMAFGITSQAQELLGSVVARIRAAWPPTILGLLLIFGAGLHYLVLGLPGLAYGERTELTPMGWRDLAQQVNRIAQEVSNASGADPLIVGMDRYQIASEVAFYATNDTGVTPETSSAHLFGSLGLMYERWVPINVQAGRTLLLVAWNSRELADTSIESRAASMGPVQDGVLMRDHRLIRRFYYRVAHNYRTAQKYD